MIVEAKSMAEILRDEFDADVIETEHDASEIAKNFLSLGELLLEIKERNGGQSCN